MGEKFSGARQGVRYRGGWNGRGTPFLVGKSDEEKRGQLSLPLESRTEETFTRQDGSTMLYTKNHLEPLYPESVEYGQHTVERRHDPTKWNGQMALRGMPTPTDPDLHRLRQQNPNLNEYQFRVLPRHVSVSQGDKRVAKLDLGHEAMEWEKFPGHREVDRIAVAPAHQGKGLAEAMYDLARMKGSQIVHSDTRSESGESFARRVGGPRLARQSGVGYDDFLGHRPRQDEV